MRKMQIFKMGSRYRVSVFSALTVYFGVDAREICANVGVQNGMRWTGAARRPDSICFRRFVKVRF